MNSQNLTQPIENLGKCPVDHKIYSSQKTFREFEDSPKRVEKSANGIWHIRGFEEAREILRSNDTTQAGFKAEQILRIPSLVNPPILFLDGKPHHEQRRKTARFFAPKTVSTNYRAMMERYADQQIAQLLKKKRVELNKLSLTMAVKVAAEVIGLTSSLLPNMDKRLDAFFNTDPGDLTKNLHDVLNFAKMQTHVLKFFLLDVKPAIQAHRKQPQDDIISYLIEEGYKDTEILIECVTYGAAGMITTREFISVATWHLLEQPTLRERYLAGSEEERYEILHEILRLEPVVGHLFRRAATDLTLESEGQTFTIPKGALLDLHIYNANMDEKTVGENPHRVCPTRTLSEPQISLPVLSFGDGTHRCVGSYIAIQETDIFLQRLLKLPNLKIERKPSVSWNEFVSGYEVRGMVLSI